jgi:phosphatidylserine/phosphatidylglycerophosphate/cardiolipin synthase-like enzyme
MGSIEILENPWRNKLMEDVRKTNKELLLVTPYFSKDVIKEILRNRKQSVNTRFLLGFSERSFKEGESDPEALYLIVGKNPKIKAKHIRNLHAKAYVFDGLEAIVTSTNLTRNGLQNNMELGIRLIGKMAQEVRRCIMAYWKGPDTTLLDEDWLTAHSRLLERAGLSG